MQDYKSTFLNNEFFMDKCNGQLGKVEKSLDQLKTYFDTKLEQFQFDTSRRVRIEDMK